MSAIAISSVPCVQTHALNATLSPEALRNIDAYWRAANYLSVGQIYLHDNPLLKRPLVPADVKRMLLGHWGTTPGQNFIYAHLNRIIKKYDLEMIYVSGSGHGGPAVVANTYLEGTYSEIYPNISQDEQGLRRLFTQFSFPGGIPSHASPECPGSMHEGGELGYSLSHSFGAVFDNPGLIVACNGGGSVHGSRLGASLAQISPYTRPAQARAGASMRQGIRRGGVHCVAAVCSRRTTMSARGVCSGQSPRYPTRDEVCLKKPLNLMSNFDRTRERV